LPGIGEEISLKLEIHLTSRFRGLGYAIVRSPDLDRTEFVEEKIWKSELLFGLLQYQTAIPLPFFLSSGMADEDP
jgi:hypothetical protein